MSNSSTPESSSTRTRHSSVAVIPVEIEIDEAIDRAGNGFFQMRLLVCFGLLFGADAAEIMLLSFLTTVLQVLWGLSDTEAATITSSVFAGQILGSILMGPLGDRLGRKPTFLIASFIITVFGFLTAISKSYGDLVFFRTMVGVGIGGLAIPFDALSEFLPLNSRGKGLIGIEYFWTLGELFVVLMAYLSLGTTGGSDDNSNDWRILVALSAIPIFLSFVLGMFFIPESPRWLLARGRHDEAIAVLQLAAKCNGVDPAVAFPAGTRLTESKEQESNNFLDLLTHTRRKNTLMIWVTWFSFGFTYFGTLLLTTDVFSSTSTAGISTTYRFDYIAILISTFSEFAGTTLIVFAIDRVGRVPSQYISYMIGGVAVLAFSLLAEFGGSRTGELIVSFISRMFFMGGISATYVHIAELLPTGIRARGHSSANLMARVGAFTSPYLVESGGYVAIGSVMLVVSLMAALSSWNLPETKGKAMGVVGNGDASSESTCNSREGDEVA